MKKTCSTCGFAKSGNFCPILKTAINPTKDTCPRHQETLETCPICGQLMLKGTGTISTELNLLVCDECGPYLYSCVTCKHRKKAPKCIADQYHGTKPIMI